MFVLICLHQISTHEHALCVDMHYKYCTCSYFVIWKLIQINIVAICFIVSIKRLYSSSILVEASIVHFEISSNLGVKVLSFIIIPSQKIAFLLTLHQVWSNLPICCVQFQIMIFPFILLMMQLDTNVIMWPWKHTNLYM